MFKCKKIYKVEYAHQLYSSYTDLCHETIHGHSGKIEIEFVNEDNAEKLNKDGMVIDFGLISDIIKGHIMQKYDHALFIPKMFRQEYIIGLKLFNKRLTVTDENPTAENFAKWIFYEVDEILQKYDIPVMVNKVVFWETDTGCATYE